MAYTTINKPTDNFNTVLYTGNGGTQSITGVGHQTDFIWVKVRDGGTNYYHYLQDTVRGTQKIIYANESSAEATITAGINTVGSDGWTTGSQGAINDSGDNFVAWNWKAGGSASSNSNGSITSSVSANTTAGFSIVSYVGYGSNSTVGHGLGVAPKMIIVKNRDTTNGWEVYHHGIGDTKYLQLHTTAAEGTSSSRWNNTSPTNTVFTVGTENGVNKSGSNLIAYCFAEKAGYSKFGKYIGNGNANGVFVYTGFKPAFVLQKNAGYTSNWILYDNKRSPINVSDEILIANTNAAEASACDVDLLSNGFKFRAVNNASSNWDGNTYIYMAFAEEPLVGSNNIAATAR